MDDLGVSIIDPNGPPGSEWWSPVREPRRLAQEKKGIWGISWGYNGDTMGILWGYIYIYSWTTSWRKLEHIDDQKPCREIEWWHLGITVCFSWVVEYSNTMHQHISTWCWQNVTFFSQAAVVAKEYQPLNSNETVPSWSGQYISGEWQEEMTAWPERRFLGIENSFLIPMILMLKTPGTHMSNRNQEILWIQRKSTESTELVTGCNASTKPGKPGAIRGPDLDTNPGVEWFVFWMHQTYSQHIMINPSSGGKSLDTWYSMILIFYSRMIGNCVTPKFQCRVSCVALGRTHLSTTMFLGTLSEHAWILYMLYLSWRASFWFVILPRTCPPIIHNYTIFVFSWSNFFVA